MCDGPGCDQSLPAAGASDASDVVIRTIDQGSQPVRLSWRKPALGRIARNQRSVEAKQRYGAARPEIDAAEISLEVSLLHSTNHNADHLAIRAEELSRQIDRRSAGGTIENELAQDRSRVLVGFERFVILAFCDAERGNRPEAGRINDDAPRIGDRQRFDVGQSADGV